jgi:hypothetical protein
MVPEERLGLAKHLAEGAMQLHDWLTIAAIIIGPLAAVLITEWNQVRRKRFDSRLFVLRAMLNTRGVPGDAGWLVAINSIPLDFHENETVMGAWHKYMDAVRFAPSAGNEEPHLSNMRAKQTGLIYAVARDLGYKITENDIQNEAYYSDAFVSRDSNLQEALRALPRIAVCQEQLRDLIRAQRATPQTVPSG